MSGAGKVHEVNGEDEARVRDAAHALLDLCRTITAAHPLPARTKPEDEAHARTSAAASLAVQSLYMADHLGGGDAKRVRNKPEEMNALLAGLADGIGNCIGTATSPVVWAIDFSMVKAAIESALLLRGSDTIKRTAKK